MILKTPKHSLTKPLLVGEAPFPGFYSGFYFVPLYALQHMYDGVSPKSRYFSYNLLIKKNRGGSRRTRLFIKHKKDFTPVPNLHFSKIFFHKYFSGWLTGKEDFWIFKPNTFFYDFFLGIFFFIVWQLGGGFRLSPLYDPTKNLNAFGFYDLRITPLAVIFKFYVKLAFFYGYEVKESFSDYYFFNRYSLTRGFMAPYAIHEQKKWGKNVDPFSYFFLPIFTLIPELLFSFIFHFFIRFFLHYFYSFMGGLIFNYENKITLFDHFWIQLYAYYIEDVCSLLRTTGRPLTYRLRLRHISTLSTFYYYQSTVLGRYWRRKFYRIFSEYGVSEFKFTSKFLSKLYRTREYEKMADFKFRVLLDATKPSHPMDPRRVPDLELFLKPHFSNFYFFRSFSFNVLQKLKQIAASRFSPFFDKNFFERFQFYTYQDATAARSAYTFRFHELKTKTFRRYKQSSEWLKSNFTDLWPYRFYVFLGFERSFFEILVQVFSAVARSFAYVWSFFAVLPGVNHITVYFYNCCVKVYRNHLKVSEYGKSNFIFRFFGYYFFTWFGVVGFNLYIKFLNSCVQAFKDSVKYVYRVLKKIFLFFYGWYSYFFWVLFRPILTILFFLYLELRFFFLFCVELVRYYRYFSIRFYYYSIKESYLVGFRKFFVGSKFFRLFTREIGEDLEESPYNNDQDLEDDYITDYLSDFPSYEDFQSVTDRPDQGYFDSLEEPDFTSHYYDYWHPRTFVGDQRPAKPNLEFFAENYFEQENDLFFQLFCIWTSPTLFDFKDYSSTIPPYYKKDTYDMTSMNPRSWYPLELTQDNDYEEDQLEYHVDAGPDELEVSESTSMHIIPFDSDRARLSKFTKFYQKKLAVWHSYQIRNNFSKIPDSLKYLPIPRENLPNSIEHWAAATKSVSQFFFTPSQHKKLGFKFDTFPEIELVWSRISYELERNPRKLYDFLSNSKNSQIFDSLQFSSSKKSSFFRIFEPKAPETSNFIRYLHDYFSGYSDLSQMQKNKHFYSRNVHHNLFVINFLNYVARSDHKNFVSKFFLLSQFPHFQEIQRAFDLFVKHEGEHVILSSSSSKKITFLEEIYAAQMSLKLSQNYSPVFVTDYWKNDDGMILWSLPNVIRRAFTRTVNFLAFRAPFRPSLANLYNFYRKNKKRRKKKKKKKINPNDWIKVFAVWCRHERDLLFWRFSIRGNRDHYYALPYVKNDDRFRSATYEKIFSTFLFDSYRSIKKGISTFSSSYKSFMFRNYKPDGLFFQYIDGEDYSNKIRERRFEETYLKRRAYFTYNQVVQGSVWSILNPVLEDLFYEVYYLNNNILFPTAFNDYKYADIFPDDYKDSGLDIYDDYIFVGGDQEFYRGFGEGGEDLIISPDEYADEDTDTLEMSDETNWKSDEYMDFSSSADEGVSHGDETGGELPVHYIQRFWFNSDWFFFSEHVDSDEGLEEWEPDEFDSMYDLDHSVDRLFFGGLKRKNHFPATDQRIFLGTLHDNFNIDKDLDYADNFKIARANAESTALIPSHIPQMANKKNYFNFFKLYFLGVVRLFLYFIYAARAGLLILFFSNFDNPKYVKLLRVRSHYLRWYSEYTSFFKYKDRLDDWIKFFEEFREDKIFYNYVKLNQKNLISEPHTSVFTDDPYGRFWFQFPFNNHLRDFSYYTAVNLLETNYLYEDLLFETRNGKPFINFEKHDGYRTDTTNVAPGSDLSGLEPKQESRIYKAPNRFFSSDPTISIYFFKIKYREKLDHVSSYPWFADRAKVETVGSDFTYLDLMFVEDMPEDDEFIDEDHEHYPSYSHNTSFYEKYVEKNRYGASRSQYLPSDGTLDGLSLEEVDWDIGSLVSFSSDDFNTHLEDFSEKYDLYASALSDWLDLVHDYFFYAINIKFKKFILGPFKYWEVASNSGWLRLAADYGIWVLIIRNFFNISLFLVFAIYGFFTITRLSYYFFGEFFSYGFNGLLVFITLFCYLIFLLRFLFKSANEFYKSLDLEEKAAIYASLVIFFYIYNLNGYMRNSAHYAWTTSGSSSSKLLLSNNHNADWRRMANDWYQMSGFQHRPEMNHYQAWFMYKLAPLRPRYFYEDQQYKHFVKHVNPDRQVFGLSLNLASYPTYFNPYNLYNFIKFQVFNVRNQNFVGYTQYDRSRERPNVFATTENTYLLLHRPYLVNWMHMGELQDAEDMAKAEIVEQGLLASASPSLYSYWAVAIDRKKYNNRQFVNPLNQSKVWTPYSPISVPRSRLPYDFRPKRFTENYNITNSHRLNSRVYSNYISTAFNKSLVVVDDIPGLIRRDVYNYKNHIKSDGTFKGTAKTRKYIRSAYKLFGKKKFPVFDSFYERSVRLRWYQIKLAQSSFLYKYSDNLRKYLFLFNPDKAKPLRDAYMLSFRDLIPYPEFLGHGGSKLAEFTTSDYFRFLDPQKKKLYFSMIEAETIESAHTLVQHLAYYPKSGTSYKFYFNAVDLTKFPLDYHFYDEYVRIYQSIVNDAKDTLPPGTPLPAPYTADFYRKLRLPVALDNFKLEMRDFIANSRLESIDKLNGFFTDYFNFKQLRYKNYYDLKPAQANNLQYETKIIQANRMRRAKLLSNYFRVAKAANKQALADYSRNSFALINPYKQNAFFNYASYDSFSKGIMRKKNNDELGVFDPFHKFKDKLLHYQSSADNRLRVYNSEADYLKPVFDLEKRVNRRLRKRRLINRHMMRYMFGWYEYWYVEATLWNIFLDFIMVRDLMENAKSLQGLTHGYTFEYKFDGFSYNPGMRNYLNSRQESSVVDYNTFVDDFKTDRTGFLKDFEEESEESKFGLVRNRWPVEYDDDPYMEAIPRYTYADKIGGVDIPPLRTDRLDFRKPHLFTRLRSEHWSEIARVPGQYERQRKPFFGVSTRDESIHRFDKKFKTAEMDEFPFHMVNHILRSYIWFNTLQRSRTIYEKSTVGRTYPYNQRFIELFEKNSDNISTYVDQFAAPLDVNEWRHYRDKAFARSPLNILANKKMDSNGMPLIFNKKELWQNNPDFDHNLDNPQVSAFEKNVALRARLKFFKTFLQDKKIYRDISSESLELSDYFEDLRTTGIFTPLGQQDVLEQEDLGNYQELFFHGMVRGNEEKGMADLVLLRARRRLDMVSQRPDFNKKEEFVEEPQRPAMTEEELKELLANFEKVDTKPKLK